MRRIQRVARNQHRNFVQLNLPPLKSTTLTDEPRRTRAIQPPGPRPTTPAVTKTATHSQPPEEPRKAFLLRISPDLMKEVEAWAQSELRSTNGQIEYLLRQAVSQRRKK
jgi:hypothetical protein